MSTTTIRQHNLWWLRLILPIVTVWHGLTEAPHSITDRNLRQQIRLLSTLIVVLVGLGDAAFLVTHRLLVPSVSLAEDPIFGALVVGNILFPLGYLLGRRQKTYQLGAVMVISNVMVLCTLAAVSDTAEYVSLIIYLVAADVLASLLLSTRGTLITLSLSLLIIAVIPLFVPAISADETINMLSTVGIISALIAVGAAVRRGYVRTIQEQSALLAEAKGLAESESRLKSLFLGMVSHELRTPLNNIMGYSDQLVMGVTGDLPAQAIEAAERIHRNGDRLNRMINDLLTLSRLENGSLTIVRHPFALVDLVGEIEGEFRELIEVKGLRFLVNIDGNMPATINNDRQRIEQIAFNLLSNALKFTDRGEIELCIRLAPPHQWEIEVRDTGIGIPAEAITRVFEKFYQYDSGSRRSFSGAGLGLAIARELAILMGGNISIQSQIDAGSTLTATLRLVPDKIAEAVTQSGGEAPRH